MTATISASPALAAKALAALRAARKRRRLGELEWFEAAYRVYMVALFGGGALLWLSDLIGDEPVDAAQTADVLRHGPAVLGMAAVVVFVVGLRSGSQGGPIALEAADVTHVLLSPVDRRRALVRPAVQRIRSAAFLGGALGAVFGQLAGRRLPGSAVSWFASGALFGLNLALLWAGAALVAHAIRLPLLVTTIVGVAGLAWQGVAITEHIPGPANLDGSLALWGVRQRAIDLVAPAISVALVVVGVAALARTSLDALARRSSLVAQLRFAVTMQDLRTVVLLRRQLSHEHTRSRPWWRLRRTGRGGPIWRRGWHSLARLPLGRLVRMTVVAGAAGACQVAAYRGTTPAIVGTTALTFILGLELLEPLSQEIDQPDRTDSFPVDRGDLLWRHTVAPAVALIPFVMVAAATALTLEGLPALPVIAVLAAPTLFAGAAGATINIVRDAPDPYSASTQQTFMPPEMAGVSTVMRTLIPLLVSALGAASVLFVRETVAADGADAALASAIRAAVGVLLVVAAVGVWVRLRDRMRRSVRSFMSEGRAYTQQQRATR